MRVLLALTPPVRAVAFCCLAAALFAFAACRQGPPPEPPSVAFAHRSHDFGRIQQGTTVRHRFRFRNNGGIDLVIDGLRTSCDCTATAAAGTTIPPGGSGAIETECDTSRLFGPQARTVTVYTSDPEQDVVTLTLAGEVAAEIAADPAELYAGHLRRGAAAGREISVMLADPNAAVNGVAAAGRVFSAVFRSGGGKTSAGRVAVRIKDDAPLGPFAETVTIRSNGRVFSVPVIGTVEGDVTVSPSHLAFGEVATGEQPSQVLVVRNTGSAPVHVLAASAAGGVAAAEVEAARDGREYHVRVTLRDHLPHGRLEATLVLRTDHPEQALMRVPISAVVKGGA